MNFEQKISLLKRRLRELESAVVAFSGGVDSAVLTMVAHQELKDKMCAATAVSESTPKQDRLLAEKFCSEHNIPQLMFQTDEFSDPKFTANTKDRCYFCKSSLYRNLKKIVEEKGFRYIIEGTNSSDLEGHRPGYKASCETDGVVTPLVDCAFTKDEVRRLASQLNLQVAAKPSSACLASRIPTGTKITAEILLKIDQAEDMIRALGIGQIRVRHHKDLARIEVDPDQIKLCVDKSKEIYNALNKLGYKYVTLDLAGYKTGSVVKS